MAEVIVEDDESISEYSDSEYEETEIDENETEDYMLQGMRWLFEQNEDEIIDDRENHVPSAQHVARLLIQEGVTIEDLVCALLCSHEDYLRAHEEEDMDDVMFEKIQRIIDESNNNEPDIPLSPFQISIFKVSLNNNPQPLEESHPLEPQPLITTERSNIIDWSAQPKY